MSRLPCDVHGGPARGRLLGMYPAIVRDGVRYAKYTRVCVDCMAQLVHNHRKDWLVQTGVLDVSEPGVCTSCGEQVPVVADLQHFYCTAYVRRDQRVDYEAMYCHDCAEMVSHEFHLEVSNGSA